MLCRAPTKTAISAQNSDENSSAEVEHARGIDQMDGSGALDQNRLDRAAEWREKYPDRTDMENRTRRVALAGSEILDETGVNDGWSRPTSSQARRE